MKRESQIIKRGDVIAFCATALMMIIAHGFSFANLMYSHDSLYFHVVLPYMKLETGRWLYPFMLLFRGFATPWMMGVFGTLYVSLAVVLVVRLFEFDLYKSLCVAALFATNVALVPLFCTYSFDADADTLALLLACFSVYALTRFHGKKRIVLPIISLIGCLALYQAFICVALGLLLLLLIKRAADCKDNDEVKQLFFAGVKDYLIMLAGAVIYVFPIFILAKLFGNVAGNDYNSAGKIAGISIKGLLKAFPGAYKVFFERLTETSMFNSPVGVVALVLLLVAVVISFAAYIKSKAQFRGSLKLIIPALLIMPLFLNAIYLVSFGTFHDLMAYAFYLVYLLPLIFDDMIPKASDNKKREKALFMAVLAVAIVSFNTVAYANGAYVHKKLVYDNTLLHAHKIWADVSSLEGYVDEDVQVVFIGEFSKSKAAYTGPTGDKYEDVLLGSNGSSMTYDSSIEQYYYAILGRDMNVEVNDPELMENETVKAMSTYPSEGYCKWVGDKVVVKLSDSID